MSGKIHRDLISLYRGNAARKASFAHVKTSEKLYSTKWIAQIDLLEAVERDCGLCKKGYEEVGSEVAR